MYDVLVTKPIHPKGMAILEKAANVYVLSSVEKMEEESMDKDAIILRIGNVNRDIIEKNSKLKVVAKHGVGVDEIDVEAATENNIPVVNAPGANANSVAEHTLTMLLALTKNLLNADKELRKGNFEFRDQANPVGVQNKAVGLIGFGVIGKKFAEKCNGIGMNVKIYDPYIQNKDKYSYEFYDNLNSIFTDSDFISLHLPLNESTKNIIKYEQLKLLGTDGYLINCARGGVIKESDLIRALKESTIAGAALDVFAEEPPAKDNELFTLDNVILSPHMAALSEEAIINMSTMVANDVVKILEGGMAKNVVNLDQIS
jgi:D-3-phosphoglycerate dehydrogenase